MFRTGKPIETESRFVVVPGAGGRGMGNDCQWGQHVLLGVMEMFWNYIEVVTVQHRKWTKCH